jgi:site-specific DNA recombinase
MDSVRIAIYARVSSARQEQEETVQSQLGELRARVRDDGFVDWHEFIDQNYSRDDLVRPDLDRLRDLVAAGEIDRLYVQSTDRLASGARLILLIEELRKHNVEVIFLRGSFDDTPEGDMALSIHGVFSQYEKVKIAERTRRGKLHWAKQGALVGYVAPYGYRFVRRSETRRAHLEVDEFQAAVVREMFTWLVEEEMSVRAIARRLTERGIPTARGAAQWQPTAVDRILRKETYKGTLVYQKDQSVLPSRRLTKDPYRRTRKTGRRVRPQEEWIPIKVPAIVDEATWDAAQRQLRRNAEFSRRNNKRHKYLLSGLIVCPRCGSKYLGGCEHGRRRYRCRATDPTLSSTGKKCTPGSVSADLIEKVVWEAIRETLGRPEALVQEYERRLQQHATPSGVETERRQIAVALRRVKNQEDRVTDAYLNEAMELDRYKVEMDRLRSRRLELERMVQEIDRREDQEEQNRRALGHVRAFCTQVSRGLDVLTFEEKQRLLRLVVERVIIVDRKARIETIIPTGHDPVELRTRDPEPVEA